jgi:hypothetical protein
MNILDLLKGKRVKVESDMGEIELTIKEVKETHHSVEVGPSTRENDWWPETRDWTTFDVTFTNGKTKEFRSLSEIKIIDS